MTCQSPYGGFGKVVGANPDLLHSFYSLAWLSLSREGGCCDDDDDEDEEEEEGGNDDDDGNELGADGGGNGTGVYDCDESRRISESMSRLSEFDCVLGFCAKRMAAFRKAVGKECS